MTAPRVHRRPDLPGRDVSGSHTRTPNVVTAPRPGPTRGRGPSPVAPPRTGVTPPSPRPADRGVGVERAPSPKILRNRPSTTNGDGARRDGVRRDIETAPRPKYPTRGSVPSNPNTIRDVPDTEVDSGSKHPYNKRRYDHGFPHGHGYPHGYGYRHDVYLDYYGGHSYRYLDRYPYRTYNYRSYRYCNGYYGDPFYYGAPFGHYGYTRLGLYFGFGGYYRYDPYYGHYDSPYLVKVDDGRAEGKNVGALDLNVRPKDAEVYLNGHYIGTTGNYDGYPQFLWLEEGEYELIFYKEGFETVRRIYDVRAGLQVDVEMRMQEGTAESPETLSHRSAPPESFAPPADDVADSGYDAGWAGNAPGGPPGTTTDAVSGVIDARQSPARVRIAVTPSDASIYVDGRFVGTGEQLGGTFGALLLEAGKHTVEIVHPSYETRTIEFEVDSGEELDLDVPSLEAG